MSFISFINLSWISETMKILWAWIGLLLGCFFLVYYIMAWISPLRSSA
jgi:hypothetical protein